jgi:predicted transcriptional regulator
MFGSFGSSRTIKMKRKTTEEASFREAALRFEDGVARVTGLYGVNPLAGRLYAVLFVSAEPISLEQLAARVSVAKSTVSVALRTLLAARVVRRLPRRADRRDWYEAVADPWEVLAEWNRRFFQPELEMWRDTGDGLRVALAARDAPKGPSGRVLRARLEALGAFGGAFEEIVAGFAGPSAERRARARTVRIEEEEP